MSVINYNRFKAHSVFGIVGTGNSVAFITRHKKVRNYVAVTACEHVMVWDLLKQIKVATLQCPANAGTARILCARPPLEGSSTHLAVGYAKGHVALFTIAGNSDIEPVIFHGHRGPVSALTFDRTGMRLASAGVDGEIVLSDVVSETGLVRLRGHKGVVTQVLFMHTRDVLVSSGRDGAIKFWDIASAHCFRTLTALTPQVWDIALVKDDSRLIVGGDDAVLQVWGLRFTAHSSAGHESPGGAAGTENKASDSPKSKFFCLDTEGERAEDDTKELVAPVLPGTEDEIKLPADDASILSVENLGRLLRSKVGRVMGLRCTGPLLACYGQYGALDVFRILNEEEVQERVRRRLKRDRKRLRATAGDEAAAEAESEAMSAEPQLADEMRAIVSLPVHGKISALSAVLDDQQQHQQSEQQMLYLATLYNNNSLAVHKWNCSGEAVIDHDNEKEELEKNTVCLLSSEGHRAEVRVAQFSSVGDTLVTLSNEAVKTWARSHYEDHCINTFPLESHVRTMVIAPGDRHAVLGTSTGHLQLLDLSTGHVVEDIAAAHTRAGTAAGSCEVTALALTADGKGLISAGNDKTVRCWKFELVSDQSSGRRLSLQDTEETVSVNDCVSCVKCSPDGRLVAVATLDNKETLYHTDTMKLHHELYGKTLPTTDMSFSSDGSILVIGCMDTTLNIHGTDFGDRRKLLKDAHTGGVTCVQFQGNTHLFFSAGRDGLIKYWDADSFQRIMTLRGHDGNIRCLSLTPKGDMLATAGQDQSIRFWHRTEELLELSEEREMERKRQDEEEAEDEELMAGQKRHVEGETKDAEAVRASKPTYRTEDAIDMILAGIEMYRQTLEYPDGPKHYLLLTYGLTDPLECFLRVLQRIKSSELEEAIIQLELPHILSVLLLLCRLGKEGRLTEVAVRVAVVAVRTNMTQLSASRDALPILRSLDAHVEKFCSQLTDSLGFNMAALQQCADRLAKKNEAFMYSDALDRLATRNKNRKRKEDATKRAMISIR
uniref:WD repeat-containing protein 3-like n=1 Tax=Hirondellea gigas TaxID=1518452 RepID=A0A2P2I0C9_9CRUS